MGETLSFKEKLKSIQFSAGAKTYPKNYYDQEALDQIGMTKDGQAEHKEIMEGKPLKWHRGVPYYKDKAGDYAKATDRDMRQVMYGTDRPKERSD